MDFDDELKYDFLEEATQNLDECESSFLELETNPSTEVLQKIFRLAHIVRNAVDHGVETPEERAASGKLPEGKVSIQCFHDGNHLVIEVKDDGKGIDPQVIRDKAQRKGLIREGADISDKDVIQLIFAPGFSTKDQVTEVSGRGVGMDVVKSNIELLGGKVTISSEKGAGSKFRISLSLTMAVIDGFVTRVGDQKYVFPLTQVEETMQMKNAEINIISGQGEYFNLRGKLIKLYRLDKTLNLKVKQASKEESAASAIIVSKFEDKTIGVAVDDILAQQQIVVKALGQEISSQKGFMGSSILGDGRPALIIDLQKMYISERSAA